MDIRYSCNQRDFKRYTTEEVRDEMLITGLYKADEVVAVYSHVDRMVTLGCMPVHVKFPSTRASTSGPTSAPITSWSAARSASSTLVTAPAPSRPTVWNIT